MEHFENLHVALESAPVQPGLWKRYVDDTCCIVKAAAVDDLLYHLNCVQPSIYSLLWRWSERAPFHSWTPLQWMEGGGLNITETNAHRLLPSLQLPPPETCEAMTGDMPINMTGQRPSP